jgi:hypothetical protein
MIEQLTIDDLGKYSPWPNRLLGFEVWKKRKKVPKEIIREYDVEKWGTLLKRVKAHEGAVSLQKVEEWDSPSSCTSLCFIENRFELLTPRQETELYLQLVKKTLLPYLPAATIVELGCGYGRVILRLAREKEFKPYGLQGGEYTKSGQELSEILSKYEQTHFQSGWCDFLSPKLTDLNIPSNSIIFTSFATPYVRTMRKHFVNALIRLNPKVVVHFEPLYEHCNGSTLLDLMRRKYIEVNGYNRNLLDLLKDQENLSKIKILREDRPAFGANPLLSCSIVVWEPVR